MSFARLTACAIYMPATILTRQDSNRYVGVEVPDRPLVRIERGNLDHLVGGFQFLAAAGLLLARLLSARAAALDQDVIGAAGAGLGAVDRTPRGPRRRARPGLGFATQAGRSGERVYLEAAARRLGACAAGASDDDEAAPVGNAPSASGWCTSPRPADRREPAAATAAARTYIRYGFGRRHAGDPPPPRRVGSRSSPLRDDAAAA